MEVDGSDTESISSSISATTSSPGEHLKPLPGAKCGSISGLLQTKLVQ